MKINIDKIVVGIDIDDTITNSSDVFIKYAREYNLKNNIDFRINTNKINQSEAFGWDEYDQKRFSKEYLKKILIEAQPKENSIKIINKLKKEGYKIYLVTSRCEDELKDMYNITKMWLLNNKVNYDKLIINSFNKDEDCLKYNVTIFIDDNYENCEKVYNNVTKNVFLYNSNYNSNYENHNFARVFNWNDIYIKIKNLEVQNEKN